jgi:hypothetical protein
MLSDYRLRTGLADRWVFQGAEWKLDKGSSHVSPSISGPRKREAEIRRWLRSVATRILNGDPEVPSVETVCSWEKDHKAAFIVITNHFRGSATFGDEDTLASND